MSVLKKPIFKVYAYVVTTTMAVKIAVVWLMLWLRTVQIYEEDFMSVRVKPG